MPRPSSTAPMDLRFLSKNFCDMSYDARRFQKSKNSWNSVDWRILKVTRRQIERTMGGW